MLFRQLARRGVGLRNFTRAFGGHAPAPPLAEGDLPPSFDRNRVMTATDIGVGPMYQEEMAEKMSMVTYDDAAVRGPFGTFEDPVPVLSNFNNRVVGCLGGGEREHAILWMQIDGDRKHMCEECGQFFRLYTITSEEDADNLSQKQKESIYLRYADHLHLPADFDPHHDDALLSALEPALETIPGSIAELERVAAIEKEEEQLRKMQQ